MNNQNNNKSVFDMIQTYADQHNISNDDIFKSDEPSEIITPVRKETAKPVEVANEPWAPSEEDLEGLDEMKKSTTGIIYDKSEWKENAEPMELKNILDDTVVKSSVDEMDELERIAYNVESSKRRLGIKHLNAPTIFNSRIVDAASDPDLNKAGARLDELILAIVDKFPDAVVEYLPKVEFSVTVDGKPFIDPSVVESVNSESANDAVVEITEVAKPTLDTASINKPHLDAKIIIDKSQISNVSFSDEDIEKIKKSREVQLNIVETSNIEYSIIDEDHDDGNPWDIDNILKQYTRKVNDMRVSLPASRYRASFTGLSYSEILDLSYSQELNSIDGEMKKWTIIFNHIKNPSIGEFKAYDYTDKKGNIIKVSAFEDFLKKTSIMDLSFSLWAVLCATCLEKEIVSIDCHGKNKDGSKCGNTYDWLYDPRSLIQMDSVPEVTLADMKITGELNDFDEIMKHYDESMLRLSNSVKLPASGFIVCFGHISAYDYLNSRMADMLAIQEDESVSLSSIFEMYGLNIVKYILLPDVIDSSKYRKITDGSDIMKVIHSLDVLDYRAINELMELMMNPYRFKFSLKNIVCPKCGTRSDLDIEDMSLLLFLIAQSLNNSEIKLIRQ